MYMRTQFSAVCLALLLCLAGGDIFSAVPSRPDLGGLDGVNRKIITAVRYGNARRVSFLLKKAHDDGAIPEWLLQYNNDLLASCEKNAILFTSGTLDTIAGWYLQQVKHYRRDVTIVPIGMLSHPWFVLTLAERPEIVMHCLDTGMPRIDICNGVLPEDIRWPLHIPVAESGGGAGRELAVPDNVELNGSLAPARNFTPVSLRWFCRLLTENRFRRPVHLSLLTVSKMFSSLPDTCALSGLTYALRRARGDAVDVERSERVFAGTGNLLNQDRRAFLQTEDANAIIMQYVFLCKRLADTRHEQGYYEREASLRHTMKELADSCVILDADAYDLLAGTAHVPAVRADLLP